MDNEGLDDVRLLGAEGEKDFTDDSSSSEHGDEFEINPVAWVDATSAVLKCQGFRTVTPTTPAKIFTLCAGTDGPVKSLEEIFGTEHVDHFASCDIDDGCLSFVQANFAPRHFYRDVKSLLEPNAWCEICQGPCDAFAQECADILVAGFPCQPYSVLNQSRWLPNYEPLKAEQAHMHAPGPWQTILPYSGSLLGHIHINA